MNTQIERKRGGKGGGEEECEGGREAQQVLNLLVVAVYLCLFLCGTYLFSSDSATSASRRSSRC